MKSFETRLVEAVKRKRENDGLSIRALSSVIGLSFSTLARIERGDGVPDNNSKIRLLEWLGADAEEDGLGFDNVAFVHFRAAKNVRSSTVQTLLQAADTLKRKGESHFPDGNELNSTSSAISEHVPVALSKEELEQTAERLREELGLAADQPLDSLSLEVEGVNFIWLTQEANLDSSIKEYLGWTACNEWSAMSVPLDQFHEHWAVLLNDRHTKERQRVTLLEEVWHILLGHKLTKIAKVAEAYGRTYDASEEHDAYYLAAATLLPRCALQKAVRAKSTSIEIADAFGTSPELVDYRLKRLGLWRDHVGKRVALSAN